MKQKSKIVYLHMGLSALVLFSIIFNSVTVVAQGDIVSSDDISGGSSVFVFRKSAKTAQTKFAAKNIAKRNAAQKSESRKAIRVQVAKTSVTRKKTAKVEPSSVAVKLPPKTNGKSGSKTGGKQQGKTGRSASDSSSIQAVNSESASTAIAGAAETYLDRGETDKAIKYFNESIKLNPRNDAAKAGLSEAFTRKANALIDTDGYEAAIPFFQQAISNDPTNAAAFAGLGSTYEQLGNDDASFQNYEKAIALNPNLTEIYAPLGDAYYQKGEIAKADELLTKAISANPNDAEISYFLGLVRYKQNRNEDAIVLLTKSNSIKESAEAHYYLGEIYDRLDKDKLAFQEYNTAVKLNPGFGDAWFDLGAANYNRGRYNDAIAAYNQALRIKNDNYDAHENLGDIYRQLKQFDNASGSYKIAIDLYEKLDKTKLDKTHLSELYSKYGFVLARNQTPKWDAAIDALNKAVLVTPDAVDLTNLGWIYYNSAQIDLKNRQTAQANLKLEKGKVALQKAVGLDKSAVGAFMNLGITLTDLGDYKGSIEALKNCVSIRDKWVPAYNELGIAYRKDLDLESAIANFKHATEIDKNFRAGLFNWAEAENARGNIKEAKKVQDRLRKLDPNMANALDAIFLDPSNRVKGAVMNKIQQNNPLNKLPRFPY